MRTLKVFKYPLDIVDSFTLEMPFDAKCLTVQSQKGVACLWALVDPSQPKVPHLFRLAGTGHPITHDEESAFSNQYIGSFQLFDGDLVFHLFKVVEREA